MDELAKQLEAEQMLDTLEALLVEATPGEWLNRGMGAISARTPQHAEGDGFTVQSELTPVAQTGAGDGWRGRAHGEHDADDHDAALVVYLHNAAPELIRLARERLADREYINGRAAELEAALLAAGAREVSAEEMAASMEDCSPVTTPAPGVTRPTNEQMAEIERLAEADKRGENMRGSGDWKRLCCNLAPALVAEVRAQRTALRDVFSIAKHASDGTNALGSIRNRVRETGALATQEDG